MKKILVVLVSFVVLMFSVFGLSKSVSADETRDWEDELSKYILTGKDLDEFEKEEQAESHIIQKRSIEDSVNYEQNYTELRNSGVLGEDVTFDMYVELATSTPPTDPVDSEFRNRSKRSISDLSAGDILVTNGTSWGGITGHAGIYVGNGQIMSIAGGGSHPATIHIMEWMYKYNKAGKWTKVYRPATRYRGASAAQWSLNNYNGKDYSYGITTNIFGKDPTYCSKIVWQAYWWASAAPQVGGMKKPLIVAPYDLPDYFDVRATHTQTWKG